jgi:hypothetical protein
LAHGLTPLLQSVRMKKFLLALAVTLPLSLACCTLNIKGAIVSGPDKGKVANATASWNGFTGSGKITMHTPWGEVAEGRYQTSMRGQSTKNWEAFESKDGTSGGDDLIITADGTGHQQLGTATLIGNQGTVIESIYWGSSASPTHGQGKAKDSRGNKYRLVW